MKCGKVTTPAWGGVSRGARSVSSRFAQLFVSAEALNGQYVSFCNKLPARILDSLLAHTLVNKSGGFEAIGRSPEPMKILMKAGGASASAFLGIYRR